MKFRKLLILVLLICLISVAALFMLTACGHKHAYTEKITKPTCTEQGYTTYECAECGEKYIDNYTEALGHDMHNQKAQSATCTEIGCGAYEACSRCDYKVGYNEIKALGHDIQEHESQAVTCTEIGWNAYQTCSRCDYTTYKEIKALGHDIQEHEAQTETCTEIGWNTYQTCSRCDYSTYKEIKALGHNIQEYEEQAATCTEIGWYAYEACSRCDYSTYEEIEALGHQINEIVVKKTCERGASITRNCSECDFTETIDDVEDISAKIYRSATTMMNNTIRSATISVGTPSGGYGEMQYKFELFSTQTSTTPSDTVDFSTSNSISVSSILGVNDNVIQITIKDNYGNYTIYRFLVGTEEILSTEVYEGEHNYVNDFCTRCGKQESSIGLLYVLNDDGSGYNVADIGTCTDNDIVIAPTYNELPVTGIGAKAFKETSITSVKIPDSVITIGSEAFYHCTKLISATIGNGVTSIGDHAFYYCSNLANISIGTSVTSIGDYSFEDCGLTSIIIPDSVTYIGSMAFRDCDKLSSAIIGNGVTSIGEWAFYCCTKLSSIILGENVTSIGSSAFRKTAIESITLPNSVLSIGHWAFFDCTYLTNIVIPSSVTFIGDSAFENCNSLKSVIFECVNDWFVYESSYSSTGTEINENILEDTSIAALYLTKTYCDYNWKRS